MPQLEKLWVENKNKGLHIFHVESQGADRDGLQSFMEKHRLTFPQTMRSGSDFSGYKGKSGLPYAFVVGVDGTVAWEGRSGYKNVIHEELKKVLYPGLGKREISKPLVKSARLFAMRKFAKSFDAATKELAKAEKADASDIAIEARYILGRIESVATKRHAAAESAKSQREFFEAYRLYKEIAAQFSGHEVGTAAKAAYKEMDKTPEIKKEIKAERELMVLLQRLKKEYNVQKKHAILQAFAKKYEGMTAGKKAELAANKVH